VTVNAISPVAATRMTGTIPSMSDASVADEGYEPLHPRASSPLVAYLASDDSAWLTGQVIRVEGNVLKRFRTWSLAPNGYAAKPGEFLKAEEMHQGVRTIFEALPIGLDVSAGLTP
jgi:hypothetical protein